MEGKIEGARIAGIAVAVPKTYETIDESSYETPENRARFALSTGVRGRHLSTAGQYGSDLALAAANTLLDSLGWDRKDIHALIYVTQRPDMNLPATACVLQDRLGLPIQSAAFDINLGCSGYPYGLYVAGSFLRPGSAKKVLLLVGDTAGKPNVPSWAHLAAPLFGDAYSATALELSPSAAPMFFQFRTNGKGWDAIMERRPGGNPPLTKRAFHYEEDEIGNMRINTQFQMKGEDVFNFSVLEAPRAIGDLLKFAQKEKQDIDAFVLHQANKIINETIRRKLKLTPELCPTTLEKFGNTSSATIPLTILWCLRDRITSEKMKLILCGFGVGLSWATTYCETDGVVLPSLVKV